MLFAPTVCGKNRDANDHNDFVLEESVVRLKMIGLTLALFSALGAVMAADLPTQVHIALAGLDSNGDSNSMTVSWNTKGATTTSTVKFGTSSGVYNNAATGAAAAYYETFNHHVTLGTLAPNTQYFYIVGDDASGWSKEYTFKSAPTYNQLRGNFSFFVFGDMGEKRADDSERYIKANKESVDLIWHAGDVGYADDSFLHLGCMTEFCYEKAFDDYLNDAEEWASLRPYMVMPGNHEADCHDPACLLSRERREKLSNFTAFNGRFKMPSKESGGIMNMFYSFNYGNVHFISFDSETDYPNAPLATRYVLPCGGFGDQLKWLEQDLIKANENSAERPWVLVAAHRPMYHSTNINKELQAAVEELFYKYGVDIYITGHVHSYERNYPTYQGVPEKTYQNPRAPSHLLIGGAGNDEMKDVPNNDVSAPGPWTVVTDGNYGIGKITIEDDNNLSFDYIQTTTGKVFDTFHLYRDHSAYGKKLLV